MRALGYCLCHVSSIGVAYSVLLHYKSISTIKQPYLACMGIQIINGIGVIKIMLVIEPTAHGCCLVYKLTGMNINKVCSVKNTL